MKRSPHVRLVLSGAVASALWTTGCGPGPSAVPEPPVLSADQSYTNNQYVPSVGYYHAPYGGWYARPYNSYLPGRGYFHGGGWWPAPHVAQVIASIPRAEAVAAANLKTEPLRAKARPVDTAPGVSGDSRRSLASDGGSDEHGGMASLDHQPRSITAPAASMQRAWSVSVAASTVSTSEAVSS